MNETSQPREPRALASLIEKRTEMKQLPIGLGELLPKGATVVAHFDELTAEQLRAYLWRGDRPRPSALVWGNPLGVFVVTNHPTRFNDDDETTSDSMTETARYLGKLIMRRDNFGGYASDND